MLSDVSIKLLGAARGSDIWTTALSHRNSNTLRMQEFSGCARGCKDPAYAQLKHPALWLSKGARAVKSYMTVTTCIHHPPTIFPMLRSYHSSISPLLAENYASPGEIAVCVMNGCTQSKNAPDIRPQEQARCSGRAHSTLCGLPLLRA